MDACLAGECEPDAIDDYVAAWHEGGDGLPLWQFLGMTSIEYSAWESDPRVLPAILKGRRQDRTFKRPRR